MSKACFHFSQLSFQTLLPPSVIEPHPFKLRSVTEVEVTKLDEFGNKVLNQLLNGENLFGDKGACGNCWCMSFRLKKSDFENGKLNNGNKIFMKQLVAQNQPTGVLAIHKDRAIAWCALAPREDFLRLKFSRVHKPIDNQKVWSIPCMFIAKEYRKKGLSIELLKGIIKFSKRKGIKILEAYPLILSSKKLPDAFVWVGLYKSFENAGFKIVDRTSKNRPMVRYSI